jgi:hypothetical protein
MGRLPNSKTDREAPLRQGQRYWAKQRPSLKKVAQCNGKNSGCVGAGLPDIPTVLQDYNPSAK